MTTTDKPVSRVLLVGGSSGTAKATVGQALMSRLGVSLVLVDDLRMAIQAVTTCGRHPALHMFAARGSHALDSPESVLAGLIAVAESLDAALRLVIAHHCRS